MQASHCDEVSKDGKDDNGDDYGDYKLRKGGKRTTASVPEDNGDYNDNESCPRPAMRSEYSG